VESKYLSAYTDWLQSGQYEISCQQYKMFFLLHGTQIDSGVHPMGGLFPHVKILGCITDHLPPYTAEVKNGGTTVHSPGMPLSTGTILPLFFLGYFPGACCLKWERVKMINSLIMKSSHKDI
jgi:hypothetical protein